MIESVLVANRGEIACRIFRTCRELGIETVAVYSDADARALHVREADLAVRLPGAAAADTYLRGELIVKAALAAGADAVHPGYGFLSENAEFAEQVSAAGLVWIGPPPPAIEAMASKTRAKELMAAAGVPLLMPVDPATATAADLPLLLKAAAGGGGRGIRLVDELDSLTGELAAASAQARSAFGDGEVFAEPYLTGGRHVEVQILGDAHGTVWALGTRDCSLQRRHQKVIEECPAPDLPAALRTSLRDAAVAAARAVGYQGAGTVEFLVSAGGKPYFLEMNTRLQVEHPVTEEVFGVDLVALQLRVADGGRLPTDPPTPSGHAVEARIYAEDPANDWAPGTGTLHALEVPVTRTATHRVRVDPGYAAGDSVGTHYDALLAKVIAWAPDRNEALRLLRHTLRRAGLHGPATNRGLLVRSLGQPDFVAARFDTGFYERHPELRQPPAGSGRLAAIAAALSDAAVRGTRGTVAARLGGWRNVPSAAHTKTYGEHEVRYHCGRDGFQVEADGVRVLTVAPGRVRLEVDGLVRDFGVSVYGDEVHVDSAVGSFRLLSRPRFPVAAPRTEPGSLLASMPGTVVRIADGLSTGSRVTAGQPLIWLEAMKMEHRITAPASGRLTALHAEPGRQVEAGALLAVVEELEDRT